MKGRLLAIGLESETDVVLARKRTRRIAELLKFDVQDQTRITTAASELVRNVLEHGGGSGRIEFHVTNDGGVPSLVIAVTDNGPGIPDLDAILAGDFHSAKGMGVGLIGARRLMDGFTAGPGPTGGTAIRIVKHLPPRTPEVTSKLLQQIGKTLAEDTPANPIDEIARQNHDLLVQLHELQDRQEALTRLNQELEDTNRGVVALYAELDERADRLKRADELKTKFLSNMSHEFRTPLNSILALSRMLLARTDGDLTPEQEKQLQFVKRGAESLTDLVNDLLDLAKVEAGKTIVAPIEFAAEEMFGALRGMLRPLLIGEAVALVFDTAEDTPPLFTDEGKVSQILRNLLSNAIKFTERGEVRVWAVMDIEADTVTFHVRDTGIGIASQDLEIVFEEFGQVRHAMQTRVKGTGLGLPLSRKLAELLGGRLNVHSVPGEGSLFSLTIPRIYRGAQITEPADENWQIQPGRIPVLVLEDDPADVIAIKRHLTGTPYQPLITGTVAGAKRILERIKPAAALFDVVLAGEETWRMLLSLRHTEDTANLPIVVVSSTGDDRKALHLGADAFLDKPVASDRLLELLDRLTGVQSVTRVLLVDDEDVTRYLVQQLLPRSNYKIREATSGRQGLDELRREPPDIVLMDLTMPEMNGFDLLEKMDGDATLSHVPAIILTSAVLDQADRRRLGRAASVLSKSDLSTVALDAAITDAIETRTRSP
jgi:signal transduction histidine kinase/CheY-like chemotaxis protein